MFAIKVTGQPVYISWVNAHGYDMGVLARARVWKTRQGAEKAKQKIRDIVGVSDAALEVVEILER